MGVKEQMIEILRNGETRRIAFSFTGTSGRSIAVDQSTFSRVADALHENRINVVEGRFDSNIASYSARADPTHNFAANTFYLGRNPRYSRLFNALIVHESVHASFDLTRTTLPWVDNEAAAYIAQAYYARNSGLPREVFDFGSQPILGYSVVQGMRSNSTIDIDFFLNALRDNLRGDPLYSGYIGGTFSGDG
jgi:hypothetical protein